MNKLMVLVVAIGFVVVGCDKAGNPTAPAAKVAEPAAKVAEPAAKVAEPAAKADSAKAAEITKADTNKDGKVTVVEYMAIYKLDEGAGKKADKNANGIIELDEFIVVAAPAAPAAPAAKK
ncbi:MAG: hypothetical protein WAX69_16785 [Victivallales bacterium]